MSTYLFLGGSLDGQRVNVIDERMHYRVVHPSGNSEITVDEAPFMTVPAYDTEVYHPTRIGGHSQRFTVYALDGWNGDDIIDRLINGSRAGEGSLNAQRLSNVQRIRIDSSRWTREESEKIEARMVGDMAREAHQNGLWFTAAPKVERTRLVYDQYANFGTRWAQPEEECDLIEFRVSALAVPR